MIDHAKSLANWLKPSNQRQSQVGFATVLVTLPQLATPFCENEV